ncbi:GNAT family protein [Leifsonia kafniensis]|uniref:GNAT family protein n=1 Tax=Leifsonia kafniensis TaxID=475957 RepID=A0ABP7KPX0_9MICO
MNAQRPEPTTLVGRYISLEPLSPEALPELHRAIAQPAVFAAGFGGGPAGLHQERDDFIAWAGRYYQWSGLPFGIRLIGGAHDGELVGSTALGDLDLYNESAQIGWTAYDPRVWGTAVNVEAKLMLLGLAFDNGFGRIMIQADAVNERSRAAIVGIGASFEGVLRRHRQRPDGSWRDSAIHSVIGEDWPRVRAGLLARLDRFDSQPVAYRSRERARTA